MITLTKIKQFIEGNVQMKLDGMGLKPKYYQEQIAYRMLKCQDCLKRKACIYCNCDVPGKLYVNKSCNDGKRFPDIMEEREWEKYKEANEIK